MIDDVVGKLQSGKEAEVYVVRTGEKYLCAKVYKDENARSFKQKTQYTEGRKVRGSRQARAMDGKSKYGRKERESAWQNTEVDALVLLGAAGVKVPQTYGYYEGVLLLEMIIDIEGNPAPRLNDVKLTPELAKEYHMVLVRQAVMMLCAGLVHGDYSEFNVLVSQNGLVIIDLPQVVQATANNAFGIFERDLRQLSAFFGRVAPEILQNEYPKEIWNFYKHSKLKPDTKLTGRFAQSTHTANVREVLGEIEAARDDDLIRRGIKKERY
jgi:RIO kinase 1